jgi:hypothetical protein
MPTMTLTPEEERENLERSVALANDYREAAELYDKDGHPKTRVFEPETPVQFRRMLRALQEWDSRKPENVSHNIQMDLNLTREDRADLRRYTAQISMGVNPNGTYFARFPTPWNEALHQFVRLLNNSQRDLLGGPCRNRKKHEDRDYWFVKKTHRLREFCSSPLCAGDATQARRREKAREKKIEKAEAAIRNYQTRPARFRELTWQEYVIEDSRPGRGKKPSISKKFLTMAVKAGRLTPPKENPNISPTMGELRQPGRRTRSQNIGPKTKHKGSELT